MPSDQAYCTPLTVMPTSENENYVQMAPAGSIACPCSLAPAQGNPVTSDGEKIYDVCP